MDLACDEPLYDRGARDSKVKDVTLNWLIICSRLGREEGEVRAGMMD